MEPQLPDANALAVAELTVQGTEYLDSLDPTRSAVENELQESQAQMQENHDTAIAEEVPQLSFDAAPSTTAIEPLKIADASSASDSSDSSDGEDKNEENEESEQDDDIVALLSDEDDDLELLRKDPTKVIPHTKNEIINPPVEKVDIVIDASLTLELLGQVSHIVDNTLVVCANPGAPAVDLESVLCLEDRTPLGRVFDVFGPVVRPLYAIRFASEKDIKDEFRSPGTKVFFVHEHSSLVFPEMVYSKGSDASSLNDEEPPEDELEYSDDEKEAAAKRRFAEKRRAAAAGLGDDMSAESENAKVRKNKRRRTAAAPADVTAAADSLNRALPAVAAGPTGVEEYTPLQRPGVANNVSAGDISVRNALPFSGPPQRPGRGRGRGRGYGADGGGRGTGGGLARAANGDWLRGPPGMHETGSAMAPPPPLPPLTSTSTATVPSYTSMPLAAYSHSANSSPAVVSVGTHTAAQPPTGLVGGYAHQQQQQLQLVQQQIAQLNYLRQLQATYQEMQQHQQAQQAQQALLMVAAHGLGQSPPSLAQFAAAPPTTVQSGLPSVATDVLTNISFFPPNPPR